MTTGAVARRRDVRAVWSNGPVRNTQIALAGVRTVDLAQLVVVSAWLFTRNDAADVAMFGIVRTLVPAIGVPAVTAVGFRIGPGSLLRIMAVLAAAGSLAMGAFVVANGPTASVLACAGVVGVALNCFRPVVSAMLPELVRSPGELVSANAATGLVEGTSSLVGPIVGSVVGAVLGVPTLLVVTSVIMLAVAGVAGRMPSVTIGPRHSVSRHGHLADYVAGGRELAANRAARLVTLLGTVQTFVRGAMSIIVVAFVIDVLRTSDAAVGLLYGAIGVGGLVGLPVAVMVVNRTGVHGALSAGLAAWGLPLAISALSPTPIAVVALFGVIGLGNSIVDISYFAVLQRSVPDRLLSRVLGLVEAMFQGGLAIGAFVGAILLDRVGPRPALFVVGLVLPALAVAVAPRLRMLDRLLGRRNAEIDRLRQHDDLADLPIATLDRLASTRAS